MTYYTNKDFSKAEFEILSEEVDIQSIEEVKVLSGTVKIQKIVDTINDLVKAIKQLDKKIK